MRLINCMECGKHVSSVVKVCPHCGKYPHPLRCNLCHKKGKVSEFHRRDYSEGFPIVHESCLKVHKATNEDMRKFSCVACKRIYYYSDMNIPKEKTIVTIKNQSSCTYCGQPFYFIQCTICLEPVVVFDTYHRDEKHKSCSDVKGRLYKEEEREENKSKDSNLGDLGDPVEGLGGVGVGVGGIIGIVSCSSNLNSGLNLFTGALYGGAIGSLLAIIISLLRYEKKN